MKDTKHHGRPKHGCSDDADGDYMPSATKIGKGLHSALRWASLSKGSFQNADWKANHMLKSWLLSMKPQEIFWDYTSWHMCTWLECRQQKQQKTTLKVFCVQTKQSKKNWWSYSSYKQCLETLGMMISISAIEEMLWSLFMSFEQDLNATAL